MNQVDNEREFTRVAVKFFAELRAEERAPILGRSSDISFNGFFLECDSTVPVGTDCEVTIVLGSGSDKVYIQALGKVARIDPNGMAVQFTKILDEHSAAHLHNLVMYNSSDQLNQIEKEFDNHAGYKRIQDI